MAKSIWEDATGVTFNDVQAGKIKKPGAPTAPAAAGKVATTISVPPPVAPLQQQLNTAMAAPVTPKSIVSTIINEGGSSIAAPSGVPAPVPAMPTPPGIEKNMATNPNPVAPYKTIADIPKPANQVQVPAGGQPAAPVASAPSDATDPDTDGRRQYSAGYGDAFANRGGYPADAPKGPSNGPNSTALDPVAPVDPNAPTSSGANFGPQNNFGQKGIGDLPNLGLGFVTGKGDGVAPEPYVKPGFDKNGVVTAESAAAAMGGNMTRSGGIYGTYDGKGVNEIIARENKIRGEMVAMKDAAAGGLLAGNTGVHIMPDRTNEANEQLQAMKLSPQEYLAYTQGKARQEAGIADSQAKNQIAIREQDLRAKTEAERLAGNPQDAQIKDNQIEAGRMTNATAKELVALHDAYKSEKDPAKRKTIAENIRILSGKDSASKYLVVPGGEYTDPENPMLKMRAPSRVLDTSTGQFTDAPEVGAKKGGVEVKAGMSVKAPDGTHTFQGKTIVVKDGKVTEVKNG